MPKIVPDWQFYSLCAAGIAIGIWHLRKWFKAGTSRSWGDLYFGTVLTVWLLYLAATWSGLIPKLF